MEDLIALADGLGLGRFALVGHDWGGAIAWVAALSRYPDRLSRLVIVNAPHPVVFQKSLFDGSSQRSASQYITAFRAPGFDELVEKNGYDWFFDKTFGGHVDLAKIPAAEKQQYIAEWSQPGAFNAMLNWYRAAKVMVPAPGLTVPLPDWLLRAFPKVPVPTLGVWGMKTPRFCRSRSRGSTRWSRISPSSAWPRRVISHRGKHRTRWPMRSRPFLAAQAEASAPAA